MYSIPAGSPIITAMVVDEVAYRCFLFYGMRLFFLHSVISSISILLVSGPSVDMGRPPWRLASNRISVSGTRGRPAWLS